MNQLNNSKQSQEQRETDRILKTKKIRKTQQAVQNTTVEPVNGEDEAIGSRQQEIKPHSTIILTNF